MIGALCAHFHWAHDAWRRMGWRELRGWLRELNRQVAGAGTDPHSWAGTEHDPGWQELRDKREKWRGNG